MSTLTGTRGLIRLILRRDRLILPLWIVFLTLIPVSYVSSFNELFPTAASRRQYADNSGFITLYGVLPDTSLGEFVTWRVGFVPVMVGLISILTVIRHTRVEEETGRRELLGSTVVGRHAALAAALATTFGANLLLGILIAVGMHSQDLALAGSVAIGLEFALAGWVFAAIGAVTAQLTSSAGTARGLALGALGASYALRAAGDTSAHADGPLWWLSWLSPIGWVQKLYPYGANRWSMAVLALVVALFLVGVAIALSARRDVGSGLLPARPGPAAGSAHLSTPLALAWRLHRGLLAAWVVAFALLGVLFGAVAKGVGDMMRDDSATREFFARIGGKAGLIDSYFVGVLTIAGLIAAAYAVQATLRLRVEETSGRAEPVLATATGRLRWATSHLVFALLGPAAALLAAGVGAGVTYGATVGEVGHQTARLMGAALVQLPAVWVLAGIAIALFGLLPRLSAAAWAGPVICLLLGIAGAAVQLDQWVLDLSPFAHLPSLPGGGLHVLPITALILIAAALAAAGLSGLRHRDLPT
ncbi:ABC transporter permease [Streptomyces sp. SID13031]|uniref:ABC transporter permease n=1 Tax=Streptomyces sp. SID13031 TaxID=2706046 RepID=UPI0013CACDEE|nr:ABC transporter permease [Streptomyces sp. SID13031]NEA30918.1 ABC transporter permease [Streptomyces sp. SID13031]